MLNNKVKNIMYYFANILVIYDHWLEIRDSRFFNCVQAANFYLSFNVTFWHFINCSCREITYWKHQFSDCKNNESNNCFYYICIFASALCWGSNTIHSFISISSRYLSVTINLGFSGTFKTNTPFHRINCSFCYMNGHDLNLI